MTQVAKKYDEAKEPKEHKLDSRVDNALTAVIREIDERADKQKARARGAAAVAQSDLGASDLNQEQIVARLKTEMAKQDQQEYGKIVCPRCLSSAVSVSDKPAPQPGVASASPGLAPGQTFIRCNECGYQPPA